MLRTMIIRWILAFIAVLAPVVALAQADDRRTRTVPDPSAPPPRVPPPVYTPPVYTPPAPPLPYRTLASAPVPDMPGATEALVTEGNVAAILTISGSGERRSFTIGSTGDLLILLADRRLMPLWPALAEWAGPGGERYRDRQIEAARRAYAEGQWVEARSTAESASRAGTRSLLQLSLLLHYGGRHDEALALLTAKRPAMPGSTDEDQFEWVALTNRIAVIHALAGELDRAIATLADAKAAMGDEQFYAVNFDVNRAAYLLESGHAAEALATIDKALAAFRGGKPGKSSADRVPGAEREFGWIRACALHRLGRVNEAQAVARRALADANPTDPQFVLKPTTAITVRYARCIDNPALAATALATELSTQPIGASAFVRLQPQRQGMPGENAFFAKVLQEPAMIAAMGDRFRVLPDAFVPALNDWRPAPTPPSPSTPAPTPAH